jgi:hypothetical protein
VVAAARDAQGRDVVDASVSIDGGPDAPVGARAVELDPGPHHFVFRRAGSSPIEQEVLLREGEKNRAITVTFASLVPPPVPHVPTTTRPVPALSWILGGVGVIGMASFATLGSVGLSNRGAYHCDTGCTASQKSAVAGQFLAADVSLGVGVVGLVLAAVLYLTRPATSTSGLLDVRPAPRGGVVVVGGRL